MLKEKAIIIILTYKFSRIINFSHYSMKRLLLTTLFCTILSYSWAQFSQEYGKISEDELNMKVYAKDSSASAVYLYENAHFEYVNTGSNVLIVYKYSCKIKILKPEGVEYANIKIPLYKTQNSSDIITSFEANAYNLEKGKIVKTKTDKQFMFSENIIDKINLTKVSMQGVKVGSVIEYKFSINSPYYLRNIPTFSTQHRIPVISGNYIAQIPNHLVVKYSINGCEYLEVNEVVKFNSLLAISGLGENVRQIAFTSKDMPALKEEPIVWNNNEHISSVEFNLIDIQIPSMVYTSYLKDWNSIEKYFKKIENFGSHFSISKIFENETKIIASKNVSDQEKIKEIHQLVLERIAFNGEYTLTCKNPIYAVKEKSGNSAEVNFILMSMLNDAGYKAFPVMLSSRESGKLTEYYPKIDNITHFIIAVKTPDGNTYYLDGSDKLSTINTLSKNYLTKGYLFNSSKENKWIDLSKISNSSSKSEIFLSFNSDMNLIGSIKRTSTNQLAYKKKLQYKSLESKKEYLKSIENRYSITIDSSSINGIDSYGNSVEEIYNIQMETLKNSSYVYLNPIIFPEINSNPFIASTRKFPIEFDYPFSNTQFITLIIPDNYTVEELPKGTKLSLLDNGITFSYLIQKRDNAIVIIYNFTQNQIIFPKMNYALIKDFIAAVVEKNSERIVLKKKS